MTEAGRSPSLSVVVPFFEEEESIPRFFEELLSVLDRHGLDAEVVDAAINHGLHLVGNCLHGETLG